MSAYDYPEIEKGVPMPPISDVGKKGRPSKYRLHDMKPGESIFLPEDKSGGIAHKATMAAQQHFHRWGGRFIVRPAIKDGVDGCRIWRVTADTRIR